MTRKWHDRRNEDRTLDFLHNAETINSILHNAALRVSHKEIEEYYKANEDNDDRTEYIKNVFYDDLTDIISKDGKHVGYKAYENVLHLWEGTHSSKTAESFLDWKIIAQYFNAIYMLERAENQKEKQVSFVADEEKEKSFNFSQEIIDTVLKQGGPRKMRIYDQFQKGSSLKENADFLKKEYGTGGCLPVIIGTNIAQNHDSNGMELMNHFEDRIHLSWKEVATRIHDLIQTDQYLTKAEMTSYLAYCENQKNIPRDQKPPEISPKDASATPDQAKSKEPERDI